MKEYVESELCDMYEDVIHGLNEVEYKKHILTIIELVLNLKLSPDIIEWDLLAEREKYEPVDTN